MHLILLLGLDCLKGIPLLKDFDNKLGLQEVECWIYKSSLMSRFSNLLTTSLNDFLTMYKRQIDLIDYINA